MSFYDAIQDHRLDVIMWMITYVDSGEFIANLDEIYRIFPYDTYVQVLEKFMKSVDFYTIEEDYMCRLFEIICETVDTDVFDAITCKFIKINSVYLNCPLNLVNMNNTLFNYSDNIEKVLEKFGTILF